MSVEIYFQAENLLPIALLVSFILALLLKFRDISFWQFCWLLQNCNNSFLVIPLGIWRSSSWSSLFKIFGADVKLPILKQKQSSIKLVFWLIQFGLPLQNQPLQMNIFRDFIFDYTNWFRHCCTKPMRIPTDPGAYCYVNKPTVSYITTP